MDIRRVGVEPDKDLEAPPPQRTIWPMGNIRFGLVIRAEPKNITQWGNLVDYQEEVFAVQKVMEWLLLRDDQDPSLHLHLHRLPCRVSGS